MRGIVFFNGQIIGLAISFVFDLPMPKPPPPPVNARILVSRNKREGWYVGWRPSLSDCRSGYAGPPRHRRHGSSP